MPDSPQPPPSAFRRAGRWFYYLPRAVQLGLAVVVVLGLLAGGYYVRTFEKDRQRQQEVAAGWRDFDTAGRRSDLAAMDAALDRVLAARPGDPIATRRKAALRAVAADADDADLAFILLNEHVRADRLPEAAREAEKVLARFPKDWLARCVLAHHALQVGRDRDLAARRLDELPDAQLPETRATPGGILYALRLFAALGRDPAPLRGVIVRRLLPQLRGADAASATPAEQAQLVECYLEPFADPNPPLVELSNHWAAVSRLVDVAMSTAVAAGDVHTLLRLGSLGPRLLGVLVVFRDASVIPPDRFDALSEEVAARTRLAWLTAQARDPTRPEPYRGLALAAVRAKDYPAAVKHLQDGLAATGDRAELLDLLIKVRGSGVGEPAEALEGAWAAAERAGGDPEKWLLAANAAVAAGRHDRAVEACRNARRPPNERHRLASVTEAALWLRTGDGAKALEVLRPLGEPALRSEPLLVRMHGRALARLEVVADLDAAFAALEQAPAVTAAFLRGALEPRSQRPGVAEAVAAWAIPKATAAADRWPDEPGLRRALADALFRQVDSTVKADESELRKPVWNADAVRAALRAFDSLPSAERSDLAAVVAVATLQLKGRNDPASALRTLAPVRAALQDVTLPAATLEVLAAAYTASGRPAEAIAVLRRGPFPADATGGYWVQLALAYHANRQPDAAEQALRDAQARYCSPRERVELVAAKIQVARGR